MRPAESSSPRPRRLDRVPWPTPSRVLVLAPHPDDFDAIGVSLRWCAQQGHRLHLAVLTGGASGVEDGYAGAHTAQDKAALREQEQLISCRLFGLPAEDCHFLRLWQEPSCAAQDAQRLRELVLKLQPSLVFMPHGNDSNATHRRAYQSMRGLITAEKLTLKACLNRDAKTLGMRSDLLMPFGEALASWKAQLLRCHASQQHRNLRTRGHGFDERVLRLNQEQAASLGIAEPFAEVFELEDYVAGRVVGGA